MALTTQQLILIEQKVTNDSKSVGVTYFLAIFLGGLGIHRFYLGYTGSAVAMLIMSIVGWLTLVLFIGAALLIAVGIWIIVDLFLIPGMVQQAKDGTRQRLTQEMMAIGGPAE